jgi:signal transduction histidine kinase
MEERIQKAGGELSIKSTPGKGTSLSFFIPLSES